MTYDRRRVAVILLPLLISCVAFALLFPGLARKRATTAPHDPLQRLPQDVELILKNYSYRETGNNLQLAVSGERVIHRGRPILGLRSNLVKASYFENIRGTIRSPKNVLSFSATEAVGDASSSTPLTLCGKVELYLNNRRYPDVRRVRVYFRRGIMEITGKHGKVDVQLKKLLSI